MPNYWQKKILTPFNRLLGVLFFMALIQAMNLEFKVVSLALSVLIVGASNSISIAKIIRSWYRFKYLLISIFVLNYYYLDSLPSALNKFFLIVLMLTVTSAYMQFEDRKQMLEAIQKLIYPMSFFGVNHENIAFLLSETLAAVEDIKFSFAYKLPDPEQVTISFEAIAKRLANIIINIESKAFAK